MKEEDIRPQNLFATYLELSLRDIDRFFSNHAAFVPVPCPACGSDEPVPGLTKHGFAYVLCARCESLYVSPRPTPAALDEYYHHAESVKFWSTHFFRETADARREKMFKPRAELLASIARQRGLSQDAEVADIGSGYGIFLEEVHRLGLFRKVWGIEPAPNLADVCRDKGFPVIMKSLEEVQDGELSVEMAAAFEVLEHVFNPLEFLRAARNILKARGCLLLTTLTVSGFDIQVLWEHSRSVHPPHHLNLISVRGMRTLFERAGFQVDELSTPGKLDLDIVGNAVRDNPEFPVPRFVAQLLKSDPAVRQDFQDFLVRSRLSSHIRIIASVP